MEVKRIEPRRTKEDAKWERSCRPVLPLSSLSPFFASFRDGGLGYGRRLRRALGLSVVSLRTKQSQLADTDRDGRRPVTASAGPSLGPIAPNKPNLPRSGRKRRCPAGPEALPTVGAIAPNKANFARAGTRERGQTRSPMPLPLGQRVRNKANSSRAVRGASTFWKRSYDAFDAETASAKQSQFPHGQQWAWAGEVARTAGGTNRAKQSQFASHRPEEAVAGRAASVAAAGDKRAKQSQFPGAGQCDGSGTDNCEPI